jgi:adenosylmethionine-8-amino-7-oxononanoate aminotransferase
MNRLAQLDHQYVWHPFTQMRDWLKQEPIVIVEGRGAVLRDSKGREYLDANSSIWTNLHGHNHPRLNDALRRQVGRIAHSSALGLANEPASQLAEALVRLANPASSCSTSRRTAAPYLSKVFFSDDGATAMEVALKLAHEFSRRSGRSQKPRFLSLENAYHGDTVGAAALGQVGLFKRAYAGLMFKTDKVMAPYCYRCPYNRAKPERADAREYRKCHWECLDKLQQRFEAQARRGSSYAAFAFEPLIQGAAGMIPQPAGWLSRAAEITRSHGTLLIADEVMTGFGRTGVPAADPLQTAGRERAIRATPSPSLSDSVNRSNPPPGSLFACHKESVQPDFLALAKGLTGGYLPLAATLTTSAVFDSFLGGYDEFKTFFHGHSYTANQLGAATALASLGLLQSPASIQARQRLEGSLRHELKALWSSPHVGDIRQIGLVAGVELVRATRTREPFPLGEGAGMRVCQAMAKHGVLTRPIGNVVVFMPPYCTTPAQMRLMVQALRDGVAVLRGKRVSG